MSKKVIEKKVERIDTYTHYHCDICDKELIEYGGDIDIVQIEVLEDYYNYPECGGKKGYAFDFCKECFERDILPHIKVKPREFKTEW